MPFSKTFSGAFEDTQPAKCVQVVIFLALSLTQSTQWVAIMCGMANVLFLSCRSVLQQKQAAELDLSREVATRLNLVDREIPAVSAPDIQSVHTAHARHSDEDIPWLTKVRLSENEVWSQG